MDLRHQAILDTPPEPSFDRITHLAARMFQAPMAAISYLDGDRQWFKARIGPSVQEIPRTSAFCDHTIRQADVMVVPDARRDPRFAANPLVTGPPHVRFYAGAPIRSPRGHAIGSLCILDRAPRSDFSAEDRADLAHLADLLIDVMEVRLARRSRSEQAQNFRQIADAIPGMIWTTRPEGGCDYVNKTWLAFKGSTLEKELGDGWHDGIHPDDRERCAEAFNRDEAARRTIQIEYRLRRYDGVYRWILDTGEPRFDADGRFLGYIGCCIDLTERHELEERQQAQQVQFQILFESNPIPMWVYDPETLAFLEVNESAVASYGYSRTEFLGRTIADIRPSGDLGRLQEYLYSDRPPLRRAGTWRHRRADGSELLVEIISHNLMFRGEAAVLVAAIDVTERVAAEEGLRQARDRAEAANRTKSEFLACMSHELRTPLNAILGFSQVMADEMLGPHSNARYREYSQDVLASGRHLLGLISGILDLAKIEAGKLSVAAVSVELAPIFDELGRLLLAQIADGQLHYDSDPGMTGTAAMVDPQHLRQMLINLIGNAIKFTPAGGRISVRATRYGREVWIEVQDTGIGIAAADLTEVTKPFVQVSGVMQRRHGGAGIGLHVTKLLAEANGGRLEIASTPGKGSTMTIVLPSAPLHTGRTPGALLSG